MNEDRPQSGYEEVEHTADWSLRVWAADFAGLLEQGARGMYHLLGIQQAQQPLTSRKLELQAPDAETLMVDFLSELLYVAEEKGFAFHHFSLRVADTRLEAELEGSPIESQTKEIKAVTYHRMTIQQGEEQLTTETMIDV